MADDFQRGASPFAQQAGTISQAEFDEGLRKHMLRVYNYMASGLALTAVIAGLTANSPALLNTLFNSGLMWVVLLAPVAMVFFLSFRIHKMSFGAAQTTFWVYAGLNGLALAPVLLVYTGEDVTRAFVSAAAMFGGMSLWGYTTKRDLTGMGSFLFMGLIGLIVAAVINLFLASSMMSFIISAVGVVIFAGLTAYDTQNIKNTYLAHAHQGDSEWLGKAAIMGALSLYLDFINMFMMLLQLFGNRE